MLAGLGDVVSHTRQPLQRVHSLEVPAEAGIHPLRPVQHRLLAIEVHQLLEFLARFLRFLGVSVSENSIGSSQSQGCRIALLLAYTCNADQAGKEDGAVDEIVRSVRLYRSPRLH
jgi:hypothetical protein